jgi:dihydrofolate reductase
MVQLRLLKAALVMRGGEGEEGLLPAGELEHRWPGTDNSLMPKLRVHNFAISLDGYAAGPDQDIDNPLGRRGLELHEWVFATRAWNQMEGREGGVEGLDDKFIAEGDLGTGATIMGRNMFGPIRGPWNDERWSGWWGDNPPYHHPVFVLTHHPHESIAMEGGTTFHFVTDGIEAALERAFDAANGGDVRLGGGAATIQQYLKLASSTRCTWRSSRYCSAAGSAFSTILTADPSAIDVSSWSAHPLSCTSD